jgi:hypothetical protein
MVTVIIRRLKASPTRIRASLVKPELKAMKNCFNMYLYPYLAGKKSLQR